MCKTSRHETSIRRTNFRTLTITDSAGRTSPSEIARVLSLAE